MLPLRMIAIDRPVTCAAVISCAILAAAALLGMVVRTKRVLNRAATGCGRPEIRVRQIRLAATLRTVRNAVPSVPLGQIANEVSRPHWSGPSGNAHHGHRLCNSGLTGAASRRNCRWVHEIAPAHLHGRGLAHCPAAGDGFGTMVGAGACGVALTPGLGAQERGHVGSPSVANYFAIPSRHSENRARAG